MPIKVFAETGCYNPGVPILNSNTNETNTFAKSQLRYPAAVSGVNWYLKGYTQQQLETLYTPVDLDTCVTQGQEYFFCIIDTTAPQVQSAPSGVGLMAVQTPIPSCGLPQDIPENLIATQCRSTPGALPILGGSSSSTSNGTTTTTTTTVSGGTGGPAVYGSTAFGSYVRSSIITCSTQAINPETGTVGGDVNPEFYVADTNSKFILIQYNSGSRKLTAGESFSFTVNQVTRVTTSGTWSGFAWTPTFNRTYGNVSYTVTAEVVRDMPDINMAHVKVGNTAARFQAEMTITGANGLSFKVKAGRNIQTRAAIYGRWEFDQKKVYWLKQTTSPIKTKNDVVIKKTPLEIQGGTGFSQDTLDLYDNVTKRNSVETSGSTSAIETKNAIKLISNVPNIPTEISNALDEISDSELTKTERTSYNIDSNKDTMKAINDSLKVNTNTTKYEHYVKDVEKSSTKKLVHTNPVTGGSRDSIDSKKSLRLLGIEVDVTKPTISIAKESDFQTKSTIKKSSLQDISQANTPTAKLTSDILVNVHDSANGAIQNINDQNQSNPYNGGAGPDNNKVKEYGPVKSFDLLPKSTETEKIQPYRYDADERMNKTFSFSLQINMFATPCGPCYTVSTSSSSSTSGGGTTSGASSSQTCSPRQSTGASITLPFQKTFINNLTPEAIRWSRITRNYQDNYTL